METELSRTDDADVDVGYKHAEEHLPPLRCEHCARVFTKKNSSLICFVFR